MHGQALIRSARCLDCLRWCDGSSLRARGWLSSVAP